MEPAGSARVWSANSAILLFLLRKFRVEAADSKYPGRCSISRHMDTCGVTGELLVSCCGVRRVVAWVTGRQWPFQTGDEMAHSETLQSACVYVRHKG